MRSPPLPPGEEQRLIARARTGDGEAIEALVRHFQDRVFSLVLRLTRNWQDAEDLTQETFVRAFQGLPAFRGEAAFFTWLYRITVNLVRDRVRADGVQPGAEPADGPESDPRDPAPSPEQAVAGRQEVRRLEVALGSLGPHLREAFLLRHVEGLSYEAMAEILGAPPATLKMRVHRACKTLRGLLEEGNAG
ncbi:MAG: sigma-70 family RNA polymerase sigma factor [Acidobacteria bacterium]|nr:sigma-70 family RNA polymerase sigma factor [Acidobacteriota bacterium]